jgi:uncharacterized protein DUF3365
MCLHLYNKFKSMTKYLISILVFGSLLTCGKKSDLTDEAVDKYTQQGMAIAQASFKSLSEQLKTALKSGGVEAAVRFCNAVALPLTDSLSSKHGAVIKRTSLKLRNSLNAPDSMETTMLKIYLQMSRMRNPVLVPKILEKNDTEIQFYAPIVIKEEACLKCHGILGQTLNEEDFAIIKRHYPADEATGYKMNQLRGMWSITLKR